MTCIGTRPPKSECPYLTSKEDRNAGTNYPACTYGPGCARPDQPCPIKE